MSNEESRKVLEDFKKQYGVYYSIADLTPTICALFGLPEPEACAGTPIPAVIDQMDKMIGEGKMQKAVLFCADALGEAQRQHYPDVFARIEKTAGFRFQSVSVMPSCTPVCYASIFTGAAPCGHGIQKYEKPVVAVPTLFDVFAQAGKSVAICSINTCSIDTIFRKRNVDYYSFRNDELSFRCAMELIEKDEYDLVLCYMTGYDSWMHENGPFSADCDREANLAADRFAALSAKMDAAWKKYNRVLVFVPDHGGHAVNEQYGGHGTDMPEDMVVNHFYSLKRGE